MIDLEVRLKLAEAMGWRVVKENAYRGSQVVGDKYVLRDPAGVWQCESLIAESFAWSELPEFEHDPAASKQVREKLAEKWDYVSLKRVRRAIEPIQFICTVWNDSDVGVRVSSHTEELAVALCALKALEAKHEGS